jgi:hypothetical protein
MSCGQSIIRACLCHDQKTFPFGTSALPGIVDSRLHHPPQPRRPGNHAGPFAAASTARATRAIRPTASNGTPPSLDQVFLVKTKTPQVSSCCPIACKVQRRTLNDCKLSRVPFARSAGSHCGIFLILRSYAGCGRLARRLRKLNCQSKGDFRGCGNFDYNPTALAEHKNSLVES